MKRFEDFEWEFDDEEEDNEDIYNSYHRHDFEKHGNFIIKISSKYKWEKFVDFCSRDNIKWVTGEVINFSRGERLNFPLIIYITSKEYHPTDRVSRSSLKHYNTNYNYPYFDLT